MRKGYRWLKRPRRLYGLWIRRVDRLVFVEKLSERALRERRNLIAISFVGILMVCLKLSPSEIPGLGISFEGASANAPEWIVFFAIVYFLLAFVVYMGVDLASARANVLDSVDVYEGSLGRDTEPSGFEEEEANLASRKSKQLEVTRRFLRARAMFEVVFPLGLGLATIMLLVGSILDCGVSPDETEQEVVRVELVGPVLVEVPGESEAEPVR